MRISAIHDADWRAGAPVLVPGAGGFSVASLGTSAVASGEGAGSLSNLFMGPLSVQAGLTWFGFVNGTDFHARAAMKF